MSEKAGLGHKGRSLYSAPKNGIADRRLPRDWTINSDVEIRISELRSV